VSLLLVVAAGCVAEAVAGVEAVTNLRLWVRISFLAFLVTSCGLPVKDKSVKDFVLTCMGADTATHDSFRGLIHQYNTEAGIEALHYTSLEDEANSPIYLSKNLNQREGKVGWGQWLSETEERRSYLPEPKTLRTTSYSMRLELDEDFIRTKINSVKDSDRTDIRKLFYHEVGHGLQMGHHPDQNSVMYYDISGDKDFSTYFSDVRAFFAE
jgi:hypothetical protein